MAAFGSLGSHRGLSPRVRGNPIRASARATNAGSIPAGAGEPDAMCSRRKTIGVYPRGCGGTAPELSGSSYPLGLSPRVRGNLVADLCQAGDQGSIPAGAGEPGRSPCIRAACTVYPRGCGGTRLTLLTASFPRGLSPRVRGNPRRSWSCPHRVGSIPAGAGEPLADRCRPGWRQVYPRGCGGTSVETGA